MEKKQYRYTGPVGDNLEEKKKQGRMGWRVPIVDLEETIKLYRAGNDPKDELRQEFDYVVFSINGPKLSILGVNKEDASTAETPANSPRPPGEFDEFPPWPP